MLEINPLIRMLLVGTFLTTCGLEPSSTTGQEFREYRQKAPRQLVLLGRESSRKGLIFQMIHHFCHQWKPGAQYRLSTSLGWTDPGAWP